MNGAIIGDIVGSVYEFHTIKQKEFKFFKPKCFYTDDSILTCAVAKASQIYLENHNLEEFKQNVIKVMKELTQKYPDAGYGENFYNWACSNESEPYDSYGNGSAMRTSPVAYVASSLEEALSLAKAQSEVTHNHPEGIKGAEAITACIYLAKEGATKEEIRQYIVDNYYDLDFKINDIYRKYQYDISAQGSVPQAIEAFLEGNDFEDCVRTSISLGGDADTLAAMTGSIAEAYYGIPEEYQEKIPEYLAQDLEEIREDFNKNVIKKNMNENKTK